MKDHRPKKKFKVAELIIRYLVCTDTPKLTKGNGLSGIY